MQPTEHPYERLYKYEIVGAGPSPIGAAEAFWLDRNGDLEFIGVRTDALAPYTHVIPAEVLTINDPHMSITVPYTIDKIRQAPHFGPHDAITEGDRERIYAYYGLTPEVP